MRAGAEKKRSGREWTALGALLVVLLGCWLLLTRYGEKQEVVSSSAVPALPQEHHQGRLDPPGGEQSRGTEGEQGVDKEQQLDPGGRGSLAQKPTVQSAGTGPLRQPKEGEPFPRESESAALEGDGKNAARASAVTGSVSVGKGLPQQQKKGEGFPGGSQAPLENDDKNAALPGEEQESLCPGAPMGNGLAAEAQLPPGRMFTDPLTRMSFVLVKGGCFRMGSSNGDPDVGPAHEVCVDDFYLGEYEVTQAQYEWVMGYNPSSFRGCELPVESVSWEDAQAYIRKLNQASGRNYRLPSEAEWEYAASTGRKDEEISSVDPRLQEYAWYVKNLGNPTSHVGRRPNGWGLYDMEYNVWEWVSDWYGANYYASSPRTNPQGPLSGSHRVLRAGNGSRYEPRSRFDKRYGALPNESRNYFGFRVALPARSLADGPAEAQKVETSKLADAPLQNETSL